MLGSIFFLDESLHDHALPEIMFQPENRPTAPPWWPIIPPILEYRHDLVFEPTFVHAPYPRSSVNTDAAADRAGASRDEVDVNLSGANLDPSVEAANALISLSAPPSVQTNECIEIGSDRDESSQIQEIFDIDQSPPVWRPLCDKCPERQKS